MLTNRSAIMSSTCELLSRNAARQQAVCAFRGLVDGQSLDSYLKGSCSMGHCGKYRTMGDRDELDPAAGFTGW